MVQSIFERPYASRALYARNLYDQGLAHNARNDGGARSEGAASLWHFYFEFTLRRMWLHNKYLTREAANMAYRQNFRSDKSRISRAATERPTNDTNMSYFALNTHAVEDVRYGPGARNRFESNGVMYDKASKEFFCYLDVTHQKRQPTKNAAHLAKKKATNPLVGEWHSFCPTPPSGTEGNNTRERLRRLRQHRLTFSQMYKYLEEAERRVFTRIYNDPSLTDAQREDFKTRYSRRRGLPDSSERRERAVPVSVRHRRGHPRSDVLRQIPQRQKPGRKAARA